jgi:uncharacterized protein (DUF362 family)
MNSRRNFIKTGLALGAAFSIVSRKGLLAAEATAGNALGATPPTGSAKPVLVAVMDGSRTAMVDKALASLGGIGMFVKKGQTVLVKPNMGWDVTPERGANTDPELVGHLVKLCLDAGAKSVSVFDNPCDEWRRAYENSGIEPAAKAAGAIIVDGKDESLYREVEIPGGIKLKHARVHGLVLDSDVFINVPVLKHHSGSLMTAGMKNLMGVIWDRRAYHREDLHQTIADFLTFKKPTLNILDAYHPMFRNGPRGLSVDDLVEKRTLLASTDIVALDAAGARLLGHQPSDVRHVKIADEMKLGTMDLDKVEIRRFKLA